MMLGPSLRSLARRHQQWRPWWEEPVILTMIESFAKTFPAAPDKPVFPSELERRAHAQGMLVGVSMVFASASDGRVLTTGDDLELLIAKVHGVLGPAITTARTRRAHDEALQQQEPE